jgi:hypothetical protein
MERRGAERLVGQAPREVDVKACACCGGTFEVDVKACACCGGGLEVRAVVTNLEVARRILDAMPREARAPTSLDVTVDYEPAFS